MYVCIFIQKHVRISLNLKAMQFVLRGYTIDITMVIWYGNYYGNIMLK